MARSNIPKQQKRQTMERLKVEGRWQAACDRREQLRDSGMTADEAWIQMEEEFPPVESPEPSSEDEAEKEAIQAELKEVLARWEGKRANALDAMYWAFDRMGDAHIRPSDAPNPTAYSLWCWTQENRGAFMRMATPWLMNRGEQREQVKDTGLDEIRRMLDELEEDD